MSADTQTKPNFEAEIRELLAETKAANTQYDSAHYRRESGLSHRLNAIEEALIRLAKAVNRR